MKNDTEPELNLNLETCLDKAELKPQEMEELINVMKQKTVFYQAETSRIEAALSKLQVIDERFKMSDECEQLVEKLNCLQHKFDTKPKDLSANNVALSHAHMLRKRHNYSAKLKICLKMYLELNETLIKRLQLLMSNYEHAEERLDQIITTTDEELKVMSQKICRYENELTKLEKKNPWLKDDKQSLPNLSLELNLLTAVRNEKDTLINQLNCYAGLKPDLQEASEQLHHVKLEYAELCKKMSKD